MRLISLQRPSSGAAVDSNLLEICDLQLLLECPLDLSSLSLFLPTEEALSENARRKKPKKGDSSELVVKAPFRRAGDGVVIDAEPWYQSADLSVLDVALINAVVISRPESMLALPFLTRNPDFTAKIFATYPTATVGKLLMQELVSSHRDFLKLYGASSLENHPEFTQCEVPEALKDCLLGEHNSGILNWHKLYSAEDVLGCMERIQTLRYGEEAPIDGCVVLTPYSSGQGIGASNWVIKGPCSSVTYVSSCDVAAAAASCASQDLTSLDGSQVLLVSAKQPTSSVEKLEMDTEAEPRSRLTTRPWVNARVEFITSHNAKPRMANSVLSEKREPQQRSLLAQVANAAADALSKGGSVLIPTSVSDTVLELIETISQEVSCAKVSGRILYVSPSAQEFLAFTNTVPEWLSSARQEKLYNGESLFGHVELLKEGKLSYFPSLSPEVVESGPCVILASHVSLRMGPSVHILNRWRQHSSNLLILTEPDIDVERFLLPFKPLSIQVKHFPLATSARSRGALSSLIDRLQPKFAVVPERLKSVVTSDCDTKILFYVHRAPLKIPSLEEELNMELSADLASRIKPKQTRSGNNAALARLSAEMHFHDGNFYLEMPRVSRMIQAPQRFCGTPDVDALLRALREKGLVDIQQSFAEQPDGSKVPVISVTFQTSASIELNGSETIIKTSDAVLRRLIADAVISCLQII
ncbi:integrator complex subunit 9 [Selaginella moellendorffii]|uniref:integrator complex subunit 9 n=1 Tax=Selaginella moellendorffii TaxID=88036 RepID=UPI000D1CEC4C|nr:integrator complex subunit 9 [Selaginella moellendorffii]|eukprot:XP_024534809.1 integrator complex subunit 9 [Selaginella moellendorffii]